MLENKTLEEVKTCIAEEINAPFPWQFDINEVAITGANGQYCHDAYVWFYIQALQREVERLKEIESQAISLPATEKILRERVKEALANAVNNGYKMGGRSAVRIAADMRDTSPELEPFDFGHTVDVVRDAI